MNNFAHWRNVYSGWRVVLIIVVAVSLRVASAEPVSVVRGTVTGIVRDTLCRHVADAVVSIGPMGMDVKTGPDGRFVVAVSASDIAAGHIVRITTRPSGYTENQVTVALNQRSEYQATIVVKSVSARTMAFTPYKQTLIIQEPYRGWVSLPAASLLNNAGLLVVEPVIAQLTTLDLTGVDRYALPGNEFIGVMTDDQRTVVALENVIAAEIKLVGASGTNYHRLATPATLRLAVPGRLLGYFADRDAIPLWYYDTNTGVWRQEGEGKIRRDPTDGRLWVAGQVVHTTWWSFAHPMRDYACLRFRPQDEVTQIPLSHVTFKAEGITFNGGTQVAIRGDEVAFTTKRTIDPTNPEQVRLMFHESGGEPTYLQQDLTQPTRYNKVSMPGLATAFSMPSIAAKHETQWENCQDLGVLNISP